MGLCDLCFNKQYGNIRDATHVINIVITPATTDTLEVCDEHYELYVEGMELKNASR